MQTDHPHDIVCLYTPQQVLPALAAVETERRRAGGFDRPVTVLAWSGADAALHERRTALLAALLRPFPAARLWTGGGPAFERSLLRRPTVGLRARVVAGRLRGDVATIYYPHDLTSDFMPAAVAAAFPAARRVCYGDGLGMVYSRRYFEHHMYGAATLRGVWQTPRTAARHAAARLRRRVIAPARGAARPAYALMLPHDPSGECLAGADLTVVPHAVATQVRGALAAAVAAPAEAARAALPAGAPLVLVGTFSESRMCDEDAEVALYREAVDAAVPGGGPIVLKPHSATRAPKVARIAQALRPHYNPVVVDQFVADIPIELLDALMEGRPVVSFSHASVALAYFGLARAVHALTDAAIERTFPPFMRAWVMESNRQYRSQLDAVRGGA